MATPDTQAASEEFSAPLDIEAKNLRMFQARTYLTDLVRMERVAYEVLSAAAPYCLTNRKYSLGPPPISATDVPEDVRRGFTESLQARGIAVKPESAIFLFVPPLGPLSSVGVKRDSSLLTMIDTATGKAMKPLWTLDRPPFTLTENLPIKVSISEAGKEKLYETRAQFICDYTPKLLRQDELIARADGSSLAVSMGLLRFANDDELALVLATELAHRMLAVLQPAQALPPRSPATAQSSSQRERDADYLGAYITSQAGFAIERAHEVWRRLAANPPSRSNDGIVQRHPVTPDRVLRQRQIVAEIRHKQLSGALVQPYRRSLPPGMRDNVPAVDEWAEPRMTEAEGADPRLNRVADVPFLSNAGRSGYQRFLNTPLRPRAFALNTVGAWSYRTGTDAATTALADCNLHGAPCYLYAVDDRVVWNAETVNNKPEPAHTTGADPRLIRVADVPHLSPEGRQGYERFLQLTTRPRAFVISPNGSGGSVWSYRSGPNASADALAQCAVRTGGRPCYLYAVDDNVVWPFDDAPVVPTSKTPDRPAGLVRPKASGYALIHDVDAVPLLQEQQTVYRAFLEKPSPRAFVLSQEGFGRYWLGPASMEDALAYCERMGEGCWLYAVDDQVVWHADKTKRLSSRGQLSRQPAENQFLNN